MKRVLIWLLISSILIGCSSVKVQNTREAKLMPEKVAKEVLAKYFSSNWVSYPSGNSPGIGCPGDYPMPFEKIKYAEVIKIGQESILNLRTWTFLPWSHYPCGVTVRTKLVKNSPPLSEDDVNDIADALVSLGAQIREIERK